MAEVGKVLGLGRGTVGERAHNEQAERLRQDPAVVAGIMALNILITEAQGFVETVMPVALAEGIPATTVLAQLLLHGIAIGRYQEQLAQKMLDDSRGFERAMGCEKDCLRIDAAQFEQNALSVYEESASEDGQHDVEASRK